MTLTPKTVNKYIISFVMHSDSDTQAEFDLQCMAEVFNNNMHSAMQIGHVNRVDGPENRPEITRVSLLRPEDLSASTSLETLKADVKAGR